MSCLKSYLDLAVRDREEDGAWCNWLNAHGKCSLTVCPECHVEDFMHAEGCTMNTMVEDRVPVPARAEW
jgi:hypothetical protein